MSGAGAPGLSGWARLHGGVERIVRPVETTAAVLAGAAAVSAMLLVSADALMRRLFDAPLTFQLYFTERYLLVALLLAGLAWGFRTGGYVRVEGVAAALPPVARDWLLRAGLLAGAFYVGWLARLGWFKFHHALIAGEVDMGVIDWPVAWSLVWIPLGCGLLAVRLALEATAPRPPGLYGADA